MASISDKWFLLRRVEIVADWPQETSSFALVLV